MKKLNVEYIRYFFRKFNYSEINSKAAEMSFYLLLSIFPFFNIYYKYYSLYTNVSFK